jgi:hypothetical protein
MTVLFVGNLARVVKLKDILADLKFAAETDQLPPDDNHYTLGVGGALYVERSTVRMSNTTLWRNRALMDGGEQPAQTASSSP